ncbi:hypothetical protein CEXT_145221 [Caerostris extrusa]|uniref:Uncharacterized protein n=1 Tax=Caerostris extrusa TaxID=172846 RepID=A0AAV4PTF1_CAEEX|nr:hypothetical protein CEXT_145221 [Caerostris extrusa]
MHPALQGIIVVHSCHGGNSNKVHAWSGFNSNLSVSMSFMRIRRQKTENWVFITSALNHGTVNPLKNAIVESSKLPFRDVICMC